MMKSFALTVACVLALALPLSAAQDKDPLADLTFGEDQTHELADFAGTVMARIPVCRS